MTKHPMRHVTVMEYVVVVAIILAAIAVGVWLFGAQICAMFGVAGSAARGAHEEAAHAVHEMRMRSADCSAKAAADSDKCWSAAEECDNRFTDDGGDERRGRQSSSLRQSMVTPVPLPDDGGETPSEAFGK